MSRLCLYCTCQGQLEKMLPAGVLHEALARGIEFMPVPQLCGGEINRFAACLGGKEQIVLAACSASSRGGLALSRVRLAASGASCALADIREGCVWPGSGQAPEQLARQAADLVHRAFAALDAGPQAAAPELAPCGEPEPPSVVPAQKPERVLVVGAGPAGLAGAGVLARLGKTVTLADRRASTGGMLNQIGKLFPHETPSPAFLERLGLPEGVDVRLKTSVVSLRRSGTGFEAELKCGDAVESDRFDAVVLATGGFPVLPGGRLRSGELKGVISQMELETRLTQAEKGGNAKLPENAVFVQCVHAREPEAPYCSAVCCPTAVKNALRLRELRPDARITVLDRQMVMPGSALEALYRRAMAAGVRFLNVASLDRIHPGGEGQVQSVRVDLPDGTTQELAADCLVCSTPLRPADGSEALARGLGIRLDSMHFICGHEPTHPLETAQDGVFVCGAARWPCYAAQAVEQGRAAGAMAASYLAAHRMPVDEFEDDGPPAVCFTALCSGCGRCVDACPHAACRIVIEDGKPHMAVEPALCRRCGTCASVCPDGAARLPAVPGSREILAVLGVLQQRKEAR